MLPSSFASPASNFAHLRDTMVDCQIRTFDVTDHAVIARFLDVSREKFLPAELAPFAYSDMPLKLPRGAAGSVCHLLPPAVLARLIQAADIKATDKVLNIASGTGYSTAILAGLAGEIVALEADLTRAENTKANLAAASLAAVKVNFGPLHDGAASEAPFDVIIINGAIEAHPEQLLQQLRTGGRLLSIVREVGAGGYGTSHVVRFESQSGRISSSVLFDADAAVLPDFRKDAEFVF
jgi:protein-L-isoaspartate(D-aspartate) O-methyltransferase